MHFRAPALTQRIDAQRSKFKPDFSHGENKRTQRESDFAKVSGVHTHPRIWVTRFSANSWIKKAATRLEIEDGRSFEGSGLRSGRLLRLMRDDGRGAGVRWETTTCGRSARCRSNSPVIDFQRGYESCVCARVHMSVAIAAPLGAGGV